LKNHKIEKEKRNKIKKKRRRCIACMHLGHGDYDEYEWGLKH
jgi:hypothetical protein